MNNAHTTITTITNSNVNEGITRQLGNHYTAALSGSRMDGDG